MAADINALNQEIAELRKQLREEPLTPFDSKDLEKALLTVKALRNEFRESSSDLDYIAKSFKDTVNEMSKQNIFYNSAKKSINSIADISRQLVDYRRGETSLSEKQLKNLENQARIKFEDIKLAIRSGQLEKDDLIAAQKALDEKDLFNDSLEQTVRIQQQVNKEVGLLGEGLEGAGKFLEKMGFAGIAKPISDAIQKTKDARIQTLLINDAIAKGKEEYEKNEKEILKLSESTKLLSKSQQTRLKNLTEENVKLKENEKSLKAQNKELDKQNSKYKNVASSIREQFTLTNAVDFVVANIAKGFLKLNEAQTEFTRETGRNIPHLDTLNNSLISSADYIKTATALTQQFGLAADAVFSSSTIEAATKLQVLMGMSAEEVGNAAALSKLNGKDLKDQSQSVLDQVGAYNKINKTALNQKTILKDVYNTSQTIQISLGGNVEKIAAANAAARSLGLSLKEVEGIADSLLDIESSIAAEFEAEVITGKQLNLEAARYFALQNDLESVSKEIGKNQEILGVFSSGNRIEQEAIAKAMGLSRDNISKMIFQQELQKGITKEQAAENAGMKLEDLERLTVQESITKSLEKMGQALAGPLEMLASMLNTIMQFSGVITTVIGSLIIYKGIQTAILGIQKIQAVYAAIKTFNEGRQLALSGAYNTSIAARQIILQKELATSVGIAAAWVIANPFKAIAGLILAAGVGAIVRSQAKSTPGLAEGGTVTGAGSVLVGEEGPEILSMRPGATVTPLTKLNAATVAQPPQPTQQAPQIDYDKMAQAMSRVQVQTNLDGVRVSSELQKAPLGLATRKI